MRVKPAPPLRVATNSRPASFWLRLPFYYRWTRTLPVHGAPGMTATVLGVWTTLAQWERMPEGDDPAWRVCTIGPFVQALRVEGAEGDEGRP